MSACERCWRDAHRDPYLDGVDEYRRLIATRDCTPEEQAGPDAGECPMCHRDTIHQHTGMCMSTRMLCGVDLGVAP